jgi:hypothetical protein
MPRYSTLVRSRPFPLKNFQINVSPIKSESKLGYDRRSVRQSFLVSKTHLGPRPGFYYCQTATMGHFHDNGDRDNDRGVSYPATSRINTTWNKRVSTHQAANLQLYSTKRKPSLSFILTCKSTARQRPQYTRPTTQQQWFLCVCAPRTYAMTSQTNSV